MKTWGLRLLIAGLALQVVDVATDGKVFGAGGALAPIDAKIPKATFPIGAGVETNMAFWLIAGGGAMYLFG